MCGIALKVMLYVVQVEDTGTYSSLCVSRLRS